MGDAADDAFDAALQDELNNWNDHFHPGPYDARFRRAPEVNSDNEHQLTRMRQRLKARGDIDAFLRIRPRID